MPWEKQFDRAAALTSAQLAFWESGYEATSLEMLLGRMGIQKGSFYATYGSKHDALMECLDAYVRERFRGFDELARQFPPLDALERHFEQVLEESSGKEAARGCFLVNTAIELTPRDSQVAKLVRQTLHSLRAFYRKQLDAARARGDLPKDFDTDKASSTLMGLSLGVRVLARAGMPQATIKAIKDQAIAVFRS